MTSTEAPGPIQRARVIAAEVARESGFHGIASLIESGERDDQLIVKTVLRALQSPTPDGVIKERGEDGRTWDEGITYGLQRLCAVLGVDPSKISWDAATETVEGDVRSVIGNILRAWAADDWQGLTAIREMLLEGQGDDDGSRILPDFQEGMTVHAMVEACVHLLERRRDALDGYAAVNGKAPASTVQPPSSQESGVGETEGWVLVPEDPTQDQLVAGNRIYHDGDTPLNIYRAMVKSAPRPSQREG